MPKKKTHLAAASNRVIEWRKENGSAKLFSLAIPSSLICIIR